MLKLKDIVKKYVTGDTTVEALKGVSVTFRDNEFVSILGQSGCGKTTLLNIIGGLDHYTSGDLVINGVSTKEYKSRDWDVYRNHSVGFVFQSYNLIPHQNVLSNVELALTLSGVSKKERRKRAIEALEKVGLGDQLYKKPSQMSGGQMQRVAIARAIVNDPDILLADEPTGALDTQTSVQVMEILKEIAKDRLIIMVTHNPELAKGYSTRIIKLLDGKIIDDSDPYDAEDEVKQESKKDKSKAGKKNSMSRITALALSFNNLLTKKGRTFMTAFAGSIGIIGIALILSLSNGVQNYIDDVQRDTLSSYPITIQKETVSIGSMVETMMNKQEDEADHSDESSIYSNDIMVDLMSTMTAELKSNNLKAFKKYIEDNKNLFSEDIVSNIQYSYGVPINIYTENEDGTVAKVNPSSVMDTFGQAIGQDMSANSMMMSDMNVWTELYDSQKMLDEQFDVIAGNWPKDESEVVLMVDSNNQISDYALYSLGLKDQREMTEIIKALMAGKSYETKQVSFSFDELLGKKYKLILPTDYYKYNDKTKIWEDKSEDELYMTSTVASAKEIKISGIVRPAKDSKSAATQTGGIGYKSSLAKYIINSVNDSDIVKQQEKNKDIDIFTGIPFDNGDKDKKITIDDVNTYIASLPEEMQAQYKEYMNNMSEEQIVAMFEKQMKNNTTDATYDGNLSKLGVCDLTDPVAINIYSTGFEQKDKVSDIISDYNKEMTDSGKEEDTIEYTDYVALMMSSVTTIINAISSILIAFVAISLVVSSIMIGIITYISVLERTKEIGILRAIGASKKDISRVFNAETVIIGFSAGFIGIVFTLLMLIPINAIINKITEISGLAKLPLAGGVILVVISVLLTFVAGLVPSHVAAKKDPVEALRSE